jgi:large subunit ribosomal protein L11
VAAARFGAKGRRRLEGLRAVSEIGQVKLTLTGGKATPAPPVGPAVGAFGLNIAMFVKEFNAITSDKVGETCVCLLHVMSDKSFTIELKTPPTAALLHKAVGKTKGSGKAGTDIIGSIDIDKLKEITEIKLPDLNVQDITRAMKIVHGTAVASGVNVEGYDEWLETAVPKPKSILDRYGSSLDNLPAPWGNGPPLETSEDEAESAEGVAA